MRTNIEPTVSVVSVSASATLATLIGAAINASTKKITLIPAATGIYFDDGTASSSSAPMGTLALEIDGGLELSKLQFYAASPTNMTVIQEG